MVKKQNKTRYQEVKQNLFMSGPRKHPVIYMFSIPVDGGHSEMCNYVVLSRRVFQRSPLLQRLDNGTLMAERPHRGMRIYFASSYCNKYKNMTHLMQCGAIS